MTVYVDDAKNVYGRMIMSHMSADTIGQLHAMADKIGLDRKWYQGNNHTKWPHYDICQAKRKLAIQEGAISITVREMIRSIKQCHTS